jgi:Na+/melibiose symporter-like transporter
MAEGKLTPSEIAAFAAPSLATTLLVTPIFSVLPSIYALNTAATMTEIGLIFVIARIIDAITDPLIGMASDRTTSRWGPRLPWMVAGAALAVPASYFLFLPPASAGPFYFFMASNVCLLAWTMITIPYAAWGAELSSNYDERSKIFAATNFVGRVGGFGFFLIPPLLAPLTGTTEINMSTMGALVVALAIILPGTIAWLALKAPVRRPQQSRHVPLMMAVRSLISNKPLLHFVGITLFAGVSAGMTGSLLLLLIQDYFRIGEYFYLLSLLMGLAGIVTIPLWVYIARVMGKHIAWGASSIAAAVVGLPLLFLSPGPDAFIPILVILTVVGVLQGSHVMLPQAMLADIADYEMLKRDVNAQGNYFSVLFLLSKVTTAVGAGVGFWIAEALGYVPNAASNPPISILLPAVILPGILALAGAVLTLYAPISRRRHAIIAKRLAQRSERAQRQAAQSAS